MPWRFKKYLKNKSSEEDQQARVKCMYMLISGVWNGEKSSREQRLQINDYKFKLIKGFGNVTQLTTKSPSGNL